MVPKIITIIPITSSILICTFFSSYVTNSVSTISLSIIKPFKPLYTKLNVKRQYTQLYCPFSSYHFSLHVSIKCSKYLFVISALLHLESIRFSFGFCRILATSLIKAPTLPLNVLISIAILYLLKRLFYNLVYIKCAPS